MAGKFQIRSRKWDVGILIACLVSLVARLRRAVPPAVDGQLDRRHRRPLFVVLLGILTFAAFAGPGIVYVLRKRVKPVKDRLPGGTMSWIRSHLYIPVLALVLGLSTPRSCRSATTCRRARCSSPSASWCRSAASPATT